MFKKRTKSIDELVNTIVKFGTDKILTQIIIKPQGEIHQVLMDDWYVKINATLDSGKDIQFKKYFTRSHSDRESYQGTYKQTEKKVIEYVNTILDRIKEDYPTVEIESK